MRRFIPCLLIVLFTLTTLCLTATTYYSRGNLSINSTSSWSTNRDGSGSSPSGFLFSSHDFYVQNGHSMYATDAWLLHSNSTVTIESGGKITSGSYNHDIQLSMEANATYEMTNTTYFYLDVISFDAASNFIFNRTTSLQIYDNISYGNVIIRNGNVICSGPNGLVVNGTLTVESGGIFYGGGSYDVTHSVNAISVEGGEFRANGSSGVLTYNITGDVTISSGTFYGAYREGTEDLAGVTYNIGGSFVNNGTYKARNRSAGGIPMYNLSGTGKLLGLGNASAQADCEHNFDLLAGSSYILTGNIHLYASRVFYIRGDFDAGTYTVARYSTIDPYIYLYGYLKTANTNGLVDNLGATFILMSNSRLTLWSGCTVEYTATANQWVSGTVYKTLILSGGGNKYVSTGNALVENNITINCQLSIGSSRTLTLQGLMSGNGSISGYGTLEITGTASAMFLVPCSISNFTLNRSSGCYLSDDMVVTNLSLYSGNLVVGPRSLTINGMLLGGGNLYTTSSSTLIIAGTAARNSLPANLNIGTLTLNRSNGSILTGTAYIWNTLNLQSGDLDLDNKQLVIYGTINQTGGTMTASSGQLTIGTGSTDITLPTHSIYYLLINRSGKTVYLKGGGYTTINGVNLQNGNLSIGSLHLMLQGSISRTNGTLIGGPNSHLTLLNSMGYTYLPELELYSLNLNNSRTCVLQGNLTARTINFSSGDLYLADYTVYAQTFGTPNAASLVYGTANSKVYFNDSSTEMSVSYIPKLNIGHFYSSINGTAWMNYYDSANTIQTSLHLGSGNLLIRSGSSLSFSDNATIYCSGGSLTGTPTFSTNINVVYEDDYTTGVEIPLGSSALTNLTVGENLTVTTGSDIALKGILTLGAGSVLNLDSNELTLDPSASIVSGSSALILGKVIQDIDDDGFNAPAVGVNIASGIYITDFTATHTAESQTLTMGVSIDRTWNLTGSFSGEQTVTFIWDSSADNGLDFSTYPAVVMLKSGSYWRPASSPVYVGGSNPRSITFTTTHFSDWTVTTEDQSLPVVLSSFTAIPTQQNYVMLNWITQSETNLLGFRIYRNTTDDVADAIGLNILIPSTNTSTEQQYSYLDEEIEEPGTYFYWLEAIDLDGHIQLFGAVSATITSQPEGPVVPPVIETVLMSVFPNPFNPVCFVKISHQTDGELSVSVYDVIGRRIATLIDITAPKGYYNLSWDGNAKDGTECSTGIYFIRCQSGKQVKTQKVVLLK